MAQIKREAWLTSVVNDKGVSNALILAESLRRARTNRRIAVVTSTKVSKTNRSLLRDVFDDVFSMEEDLLPDGHHLTLEAQAKLHAFSLCMFEKCIFMSPTTMVLENADKVFEDDNDGQCNFVTAPTSNSGDGETLIDLSLFLFKPCLKLYKTLVAKASSNGKTLSGNYLKAWFDKNQDSSGEKKMGHFRTNCVIKFDLELGYLQDSDSTHAPIVQFLQSEKYGDASECILERLAALKKMHNIGLHEKLIAEKWIELYHDWATPLLKDPSRVSTNQEMYNSEPIAIIGMSCRYPGANNLQEFWNLLHEGQEGIREPPAFRWVKEHALRLTHEARKTQAGFLSCPVDEFDARFFGVSPKEAAFMDPQARLLHEVLWESLEDSGIDPQSLYGSRTGLFTGSWIQDYKDLIQISPEYEFFRCYMGNSIGAVAARLSFLLGLVGPSIATESACSSSVVAVDMAIKSLRSGESNLALAGGVNMLLHPYQGDILKFVVSPTGRCRTFDAKADGYGRAEGCGVLVLKRLSDALRDRDNIWAMIRGTALTMEGVSRSLGTPTVHCESLAMNLALKDAGVSPEQVSYVEAHGTGTLVGDTMEVAAIAKSYHTALRKEPLIIGSVKTNVGHGESCSGVTGIMKTVLAFQHELIPKHRNLENLNPEINLDAVPALVPMENMPWPKVPGTPRIVAVNSFGITGTDGHMILQEAPEYQLPRFTLGLERPLHIITVSGKSEAALGELLQGYRSILEERSSTNGTDKLSDIAYSANTGRALFPHRAVVIAESFQTAIKTIDEKLYLSGEIISGGGGGDSSRKICFLFTGQGSQYQGMAKLLYETSPIFRIHFDACDRTLREMYNLSIREVLWESDPSSKELSRTIYSQTSIFCVEYCLLKLWESWGIRPDYVLGHSLGEFCAAVAAGALDFKDALKLVAERSQLIDSLPRGSMLVIKASKPEVEKLMKSVKVDLDLAAVNSGDQTVVAGDAEVVQTFLTYLKSQGQKAVVLEATHAFHSRHMDPMLERYRKIAETIKYKPGNGKVQYISGVYGNVVSNLLELDPDYWVRHTREKVNFLQACQALAELGCQDFLEVGAQPVLSSFVMMNNDGISVNCYPSLRRGTNDWDTMLTTLAKLHLTGYMVDWKGFDKPYVRSKVSLPFHPFYRKSFWIEGHGAGLVPIHPLIGKTVSNASQVGIFQNDLSTKSLPYFRDHCIGNRIVYPGAAFAEMLMAAGYCFTNCLSEVLEMPRRPLRIESFKIDAPLELKEERSSRIQCTVNLEPSDHEKEQGFQVKVFRQLNSDGEQGKWVQHAQAKFLTTFSKNDTLTMWKPKRIKEIMENHEVSSPEALYKRADTGGLIFGDNFKPIRRHWNVKNNLNGKEAFDEVVAEIVIPEDANKYLLHAVVIDAMFQGVVCSRFRYEQTTTIAIPIAFAKLTLFLGAGDWEKELDGHPYLYVHSWLEQNKPCVFVGGLVGEKEIPIALIEGVELIETNVRTIESVLEQQTRGVPDAWEEVWKVIPGRSLSGRVKLEHLRISEKEEQQVEEESSENQRKTANRLIYLYIMKALHEIGWKPEVHEKFTVTDFRSRFGILAKYDNLLQFYFETIQSESQPENVQLEWDGANKSWMIRSLSTFKLEKIQREIDLLKSSMVEKWDICEDISKNLVHILKGQENPMTILFPEKKESDLDEFHKRHPDHMIIERKSLQFVKNAVEEIHARNLNDNGTASGRNLRVLEVGGCFSGSKIDLSISMTKQVMEHLTKIWGDRWEYTYTETRGAFLGSAESQLEEYKQNIKLCQFDDQEGPLEQGIPLNYFDIVLVTSADYQLPGNKLIKESMGHLRQILRENGVFCLMGVISPPAAELTFVWGLLDGYWQTNMGANSCLEEQSWRQVMHQSGFSPLKITRSKSAFGCVTAHATDRVYHEEKRKEDTWIVFATQKCSATENIACMLETCGYHVVTVYPSSDAGESTDSKVLIPADSEDASKIESILKQHNVQGVIFGWGMNLEEKHQAMISLPFMNVAKAILNMKKLPKLYVITQGVHNITEDIIGNPTAATLIGMAKSLKNECFELLVKCVDLEANGDLALMADQIMFEISMGMGKEDDFNLVQVAYRDGVRYEPRFMKATLPHAGEELKLPSGTDRFHLAHPHTRMINDLTFEAVDHEELKEGMVEVKTKAYALNLKDIFTIIKPIPEFERLRALGLDFAGVVTRVGPGVDPEQCKVGDRVLGSNYESQMPSYIVTRAATIMRIPDQMSFWEASTLPLVFSTAFYSLIQVARLKASDTILIHTGAGGVGMSAIQIAKSLGVNIITTAGNSRKRAYLKSIGIQHVFHSRNTNYEQEIMKVTNGRGVDVVLNSLTGPHFKEATLRSCAKNARWVEISKITIWTPEEVQNLRSDVEYTIIDVTDLATEDWGRMMSTLNQFLQTGFIQHVPFSKFDALNIRQALHYFQKAKHIGKLICVMPEVSLKNGQYQVSVPLFNEDSTYLITGGLGGIGFEVCKWMLEKGATDIVLVGRSPPKGEIEEQIRDLNDKGFKVMVMLGDVGEYVRCKDIISEISKLNPRKPLRGVMHSAGVLRDNLFGNQTWDSFNATFRSKVNGTWNLHELTKHLALEHFVMFSSLTALIGTPGQPNHAAANCFEDAFAHYRWGIGLPATTVNWGQWAQVGCAKELTLTGVLPVSVKRMLNGLEVLLKTPKIQACFSEFESFANLSMICPQLKSYLDPRLWKQVNDSTEGMKGMNAEQFWKDIDNCKEKQEKVGVLSGYLKKTLRNALRMDPDEPFNDDQNIRDLGADSLMLMELKNSIQSLLGGRLQITATMLKDCNTVRELATTIVDKIEGDESMVEITRLSPDALIELLEKDCKLEEDINGGVEMAVANSSMIKTVLVTGVTGQLGPHILAKLCDREVCPEVETIICLIRSNDEGQETEDKMKTVLESMQLTSKVDMARVRCLRGNVTQKWLGLTEAVYNELCEDVDGVIHCAVKSDHVAPYTVVENGDGNDIRSVNVLGTKHLLRFCGERKRKYMYYASLFSSIFGSEQGNTETEEEPKRTRNCWPEFSDLKLFVNNEATGYPISKMASELLMKQANDRGIPCKVFRFPWIAGSSDAGWVDYSKSHYILRFLTYLKLKMIPSVPMPANVLPVDVCADASLRLFFMDEAPSQIFNVCHPCPELEQEFARVAKAEFGVELAIVEFQQFLQQLQTSESPLAPMKEIYQRAEKSEKYFSQGMIGKEFFIEPEKFFKNSEVDKLLPNYADKIDSSMEIIKRDLHFIKRRGIFQQLGL